ncbi:MAG: DUF2341 domain-containing protein [Gammaproteobacteria bacterium]|nr:DUF2341 domain-containing protein [Gammaproteobacteria bacterium]
MFFLRALALFGLTALTVQANAWWNPDWAYRKAITLDTTSAGAAVQQDLLDVPVLVRLHTGNFSHFLDLTDGGGDIRVVAGDDKTPLQHHIEKLDVVNELAFIWVKVPVVKGDRGPAPLVPADEAEVVPDGTNKIYLYFGNPQALGSTSSAGTYGPGNALVYHFDDAGGAPLDRSGNALPVLSARGLVSSPSLIGDGVRFAGNGVLNIADSPQLAVEPTRGWGMSVWLKMDAPQTDAWVFDRANDKQRLNLSIDGTTLRLTYTDGAGVTHSPPEAQLMLGAWHHLAVSLRDATMFLYVDGVEAGTVAIPAEAMTGDMTMGAAEDGTHGLQAELDELRINAEAPAAGLIRFGAVTEGRDGLGVTYLADESTDTEGGGETSDAGHSSYFGIILNQVLGNDQAIIEQSVILICALMALVAFAVMVLKQAYLMVCRKSSERFLQAYEDVGLGAGRGLDALLPDEAAYGKSPLFRVYRQGIKELQRRLDRDEGGGINERSLMAIRAAMDAVMVREGQKLNAQMVLLTIAISGGPFIGLLGTVVGVMVTFAAIAASGDVNINAIAPGMAAALLATTAGLGVAIPALFGYNYLGSKVKEISADMHVYADEFLSRINELHGV